jgi:hypothetical protein
VLDAGSLDERIEVPDVDESRAAAVRMRGDRPSKLVLAVLGVDVDDLSRLDVRAVLHGHPGESVAELASGLHGEAIL